MPIRMIIGVGFMVHGWAKWNRGPAAFAELLKQAQVPLPLANAWLVTLLEIADPWRCGSFVDRCAKTKSPTTTGFGNSRLI